MSKFKVGDRVKSTSIDNRKVYYGTVYKCSDRLLWVDLDDKTRGIKTEAGHNNVWVLHSDEWELVNESHHSIHITCTDNKTTHAVKKVDGKIVARSKAVCCPSDTFDFAIGANLAYDRLMRPEVLVKCATTAPAEPVKETMKLYCVRDYDSGLGRTYTKGKVYVANERGLFPSDNGKCGEIFDARGLFLVPLIKRPAKVGEWVYISDAAPTGEQTYKNGDVFQITHMHKYFSHNVCNDQQGDWFEDEEYLVLDGYKPEPEKAEPEYLNMRVVCVAGSNGFTVGKLYEFKNGVVVDDDGDVRPSNGNIKIESLSDLYLRDWENKFIEFKGEWVDLWHI